MARTSTWDAEILVDCYTDRDGKFSTVPTQWIKRIKTTWKWYMNYGHPYVMAILG